MNAEVGEALRCGPRGTRGTPRNQDNGTVRYGIRFSIHAYRTRPRNTDDEHVYLVVDVLPYASAPLETHQVGVQVTTPLESPDHTLPSGGRCGYLVQAHWVASGHVTPVLSRS
jgi:hypothetical protein